MILRPDFYGKYPNFEGLVGKPYPTQGLVLNNDGVVEKLWVNGPWIKRVFNWTITFGASERSHRSGNARRIWKQVCGLSRRMGKSPDRIPCPGPVPRLPAPAQKNSIVFALMPTA